jgi:hypothetical protein
VFSSVSAMLVSSISSGVSALSPAAMCVDMCSNNYRKIRPAAGSWTLPGDLQPILEIFNFDTRTGFFRHKPGHARFKVREIIQELQSQGISICKHIAVPSMAGAEVSNAISRVSFATASTSSYGSTRARSCSMMSTITVYEIELVMAFNKEKGNFLRPVAG